MQAKTIRTLLVALAFALPLTTTSARQDGDRDRRDDDNRDCQDTEHHQHNVKTPVALTGVITVPGNPILSADITWVDPGTERLYVTDRSNSGVDIIDAENDVYVGRVTGMVGVVGASDGTTANNGSGPNGVLVTPKRVLWAGDGNSTVTVADVDPNSSTYLGTIIKISTAIPACDTGGHWCGRADELGYDPKHHVILIANNAPLSPTPPHALIDPYATFINADFPYNVLGTITYPGAGGLEQPLWDSALGKDGRFLLTVVGKVTGGVVVSPPKISVINSTTMKEESAYSFTGPHSCFALTGTVSGSITGIALAAAQHLLVSACGQPMILNALNLKPTATPVVIKQVGGGDEVWSNPGDGRFYVTAASNTGTPPVQSLGVIDAETKTWLQNVPQVRGKNPSALPENNHIFTVVTINAAIAAGTAPDDSVCATAFGFKKTGCIAVFTHTGEEAGEGESEDRDSDRDK